MDKGKGKKGSRVLKTPGKHLIIGGKFFFLKYSALSFVGKERGKKGRTIRGMQH